MGSLTELETRLLAEISREILWQHTKGIAQWERISGTSGEGAAVGYMRQELESYGLKTALHEFEALLGWPEEAQLEVRTPERRQFRAITHSFVPSTQPEGFEAEVVYLGGGEKADFEGRPVAGKIVVMEGMVSSLKVLRANSYGVAGGIFITGDRLRDMCVSPVWGTPTTRTAKLLPDIPVVSIDRETGDGLKALLGKSPVTAWLKTKTFWDWRTVPLLVGEIPGAVDPEQFVLLSGHHCSWYYGAMDNGSANATMLEVARVLAAHRMEMRRSFRVAFWPGHTQGRYAGSTWYFDQFWEDLYDNCVLHVNVDSTGARGANVYHSMGMPETQRFALSALRDSIGAEGHPRRESRSGDQSFWACGVPSIWMELSQAPAELAADLGGTSLFSAVGEDTAALRGSGMPWWWHTPEDTLDKIDPEVLELDTRAYLLACLRAAEATVLPFDYRPAAEQIRQTLENYQAGAGERFNLGVVIERASQLEVAAAELDDVLEQLRHRDEVGGLATIANRGAMAVDRALVMINFTASGPFDQDLAVPIPPVPLLEPASRLGEMDPMASETRYLVTELTRNRNQVAFYLREAVKVARETVESLRRALGD